MHKLHVILVAGLFAAAAVLGTTAVLRTKAGAPRTSDTAVRARVSQLDRLEAELHAQLAKRPPALPPLRHAAPAPQVVYHRPPPVVVVRHTAHHDDEHEGGADD